MHIVNYLQIMSLTGGLLLTQLAFSQQIKTVMFSENQVTKVKTGLGIATQIVIDPTEEVKQYGTGFTNAWNMTREENIFYLSPKQERADTNMFINTNKRRYLLELEVVSTKWKELKDAKDSGVNYKVIYVYDQSKMPAPAIEPATVQSQAINLSTVGPSVSTSGSTKSSSAKPHITGFVDYYMNYDYKAGEESQDIVPLRVYDDDRFTYLVMKPKAMPSVFSKDTEYGDENVVNKNVEGETIKVHGVYSYLVLRDGERVVGIRRNKVK